MASKPRKVKPAKVKLKQGRNETKDNYRKRVADAERAAFQAAANANRKIDKDWELAQKRKQRMTRADEETGAEMWVTTRRKGWFGTSTGHHD